VSPADPPRLNLSVLDLFCGAGGLSQGFHAAGFDVVFALDSDFDSCETYRANHAETKVEHASIIDRTPHDWAQLVGPVDVIVGGPSCQGFSTHGRRDPEDKRNRLWQNMHDMVAELAPRAFLMENVPGLVSHRDGHFSGHIISEFANLGYRVEGKILLAADYGIPQLRRRVFLVGMRDDREFVFPAETHLGGWRRDTLDLWEERRIERGLARHITCGEALADLPLLLKPGADPTHYTKLATVSDYARWVRGRSRRVRDHDASPVWPKYAPLLPFIPVGGTWRDIPGHLLPDRFRGMRRTDSTNLLGRLDPDRPAYTITTQLNNVTAGCFTHPFEDRALSVREGARLQSFPDSYVFVGSVESRCRQVGNAVPPRLAHHLAVAIAEALDAETPRRPRMVRSTHDTATGLQAPTDTTKRRMKRQPRRDTVPETLIAAELSARGFSFQTGVRPVPEERREADIVFDAEKVVVLVDGCFWHGCPKHSRPTKSNTRWWADKIARNKERDQVTDALFRRAGYKVVRVWEHEHPTVAAERIGRVVAQRRQRVDRRKK
jgi:DNA (cytosine-5)-methyltransferase 1